VKTARGNHAQSKMTKGIIMMKTRARMSGVAILLAVLTAGPMPNILAATPPANASSEVAVKEVAIKIDNFSFSPATITVPVGTTVRWTNRDDIPHTVVSDDKVFKSKALDTDEAFTYTFTKPGTYGYFCSIHPKMIAKVVVQ
jgi:plastocyanin